LRALMLQPSIGWRYYEREGRSDFVVVAIAE